MSSIVMLKRYINITNRLLLNASDCLESLKKPLEHSHGVMCRILLQKRNTKVPGFLVTADGHGLDRLRAIAGR